MKHQTSGVKVLVLSATPPRRGLQKEESPYFQQGGKQCDYTRYIEAITGEEFSIDVLIPTDFDFKRCPTAQASVEIDGVKNLFVRYITEDNIPEFNDEEGTFQLSEFPMSVSKKSKRYWYRPTFGEAEIDHIASTEQKDFSQRGKIVVSVVRGYLAPNGEQLPAPSPDSFSSQVTESVAAIGGKTHYLKTVQVRPSSFKPPRLQQGLFIPAKGVDGNPITFTFVYTSKKFLQAQQNASALPPTVAAYSSQLRSPAVQPMSTLNQLRLRSNEPESTDPTQTEVDESKASERSASITPEPSIASRPKLSRHNDLDVATEDQSSRQSGRLRIKRARIDKFGYPTHATVNLVPRSNAKAKPRAKPTLKRKLAEAQNSHCDDCDDEEALPKQRVKIEISDDEKPAPTKAATKTPSIPTAANRVMQATNNAAATDRSKEREKAKLMLELEEIRIKKRLMELED